MIFLIAKKADITRSGDVERGHASQRKIELAPDDVTIDPTGELGKREGKCQREGVLKPQDYCLPPAGAGSAALGFTSSAGVREPGGASLLRSLRSVEVRSVASLV